VDAEEIGRLIAELEIRVERLRSLYEQYFMGIERLEPLTVRKDIDRRLWALRREQIRNTGLRFKLETTIQRYNTYQQYWQRIVREIEAGTYQRDLGRAAQRFGDNVVTAFAKRRQKMFEKAVEKKAERDAIRRPEASTETPSTEAGEEASPSSDETYEVTFEDSEAAEPAPTRSPYAASPEPHIPLELEIGDPRPQHPPPIAAPAAKAAPPPAAPRHGLPLPPLGAARPAVSAAHAPPLPGAPRASSSGPGFAPSPPLASRNLDVGVKPGSPVAAKPATPTVATTLDRHATPIATGAKPATPFAPSPKPAAPFAPGPKPAAPFATAKPAVPFATAAKPTMPVASHARPAPTAPSGEPPLSFGKPATSAPKAAPALPLQPSAAGAAAKPAAAAAAKAPPAGRSPLAPATAAKPAVPAAPQPPAAPPARAPAPSRPDPAGPAVLGEDNNLSPIRMRQIYGAFVEAKRRANESTASVTYEKIASNLQNVAKELRAKHKARSVDFEVVMKNGKPVLKPVVKG